MPYFNYTIRDATGQTRTGKVEAPNAEELRKRLQEEGLQVIEISEDRKAPRVPAGGYGRVKLSDLAIFARQFSTMLDAGVSLVRCLDVLQQQTNNARLRKILIDLSTRVESGESLSRAMARHPKAFSQLIIGLIRAGEVGGVLEESLQRIAAFLEKDVELRRKIRSALTYPVIVLLAAIGIVIFLVSWLVPQFANLFKELGIKEMPAPTQFLIDLSAFLTQKWYIMIIAVVVVFIAYRLFVSTRVGRRVADRVKLRVPVFGPLHHKIVMARFSRTMGTLLASGVPILQAMETVAGVVGNSVVSDAVLESRARIREGEKIADPLQKSKMFPPMVVHMVSVGEESGSLDHMLNKIADFYENEVEMTIASLTAAIEPVMIVLLGFIVGFIVISMFLPMIEVISNLSQNQGT
ncbi:MAG: type II secretion system F family protein [Fimbriimonadales bacterium]|jgi:type IV pilus assembly protein PilC|nr:type II secretion system F family protein [Armatimonadota bacterium]MCX7688291.1 type II secretion system F family protein [Fimbriimonadales bacterium]GBC90937.1 Type II secretion system protein F [bacterium HR14]CUU38180.1 type IV pilus assembly protein PilC [Armatimonadetes bacterium DC]